MEIALKKILTIVVFAIIAVIILLTIGMVTGLIKGLPGEILCNAVCGLKIDFPGLGLIVSNLGCTC